MPNCLKEKLQYSAQIKGLKLHEEIVERINATFSNDDYIPALKKLKCWLEIKNKRAGKDTRE